MLFKMISKPNSASPSSRTAPNYPKQIAFSFAAFGLFLTASFSFASPTTLSSRPQSTNENGLSSPSTSTSTAASAIQFHSPATAASEDEATASSLAGNSLEKASEDQDSLKIALDSIQRPRRDIMRYAWNPRGKRDRPYSNIKGLARYRYPVLKRDGSSRIEDGAFGDILMPRDISIPDEEELEGLYGQPEDIGQGYHRLRPEELSMIEQAKLESERKSEEILDRLLKYYVAELAEEELEKEERIRESILEAVERELEERGEINRKRSSIFRERQRLEDQDEDERTTKRKRYSPYSSQRDNNQLEAEEEEQLSEDIARLAELLWENEYRNRQLEDYNRARGAHPEVDTDRVQFLDKRYLLPQMARPFGWNRRSVRSGDKYDIDDDVSQESDFNPMHTDHIAKRMAYGEDGMGDDMEDDIPEVQSQEGMYGPSEDEPRTLADTEGDDDEHQSQELHPWQDQDDTEGKSDSNAQLLADDEQLMMPKSKRLGNRSPITQSEQDQSKAESNLQIKKRYAMLPPGIPLNTVINHNHRNRPLKYLARRKKNFNKANQEIGKIFNVQTNDVEHSDVSGHGPNPPVLELRKSLKAKSKKQDGLENFTEKKQPKESSSPKKNVENNSIDAHKRPTRSVHGPGSRLAKVRLHKKDVDWSDYFGFDKRTPVKRSSEHHHGESDAAKDEKHRSQHEFFESMARAFAVKKRSVQSVLQEDSDMSKESLNKNLGKMTDHIRGLEDAILEDAIKFTGSSIGQGLSSTKVKERVISRLKTAYDLERLGEALNQISENLSSKRESEIDGKDDAVAKGNASAGASDNSPSDVKKKKKKPATKKDSNASPAEGTFLEHSVELGSPHDAIISLRPGIPRGAGPSDDTDEDPDCPLVLQFKDACSEIMSEASIRSRALENACLRYQSCKTCTSPNFDMSALATCDIYFFEEIGTHCGSDRKCRHDLSRLLVPIQKVKTNIGRWNSKVACSKEKKCLQAFFE